MTGQLGEERSRWRTAQDKLFGGNGWLRTLAEANQHFFLDSSGFSSQLGEMWSNNETEKKTHTLPHWWSNVLDFSTRTPGPYGVCSAINNNNNDNYCNCWKNCGPPPALSMVLKIVSGPCTQNAASSGWWRWCTHLLCTSWGSIKATSCLKSSLAHEDLGLSLFESCVQ